MEIDPRRTIHYKLPSKTLEDGLVLLGKSDEEILIMFEKCKEDPVIHIYITMVQEVNSSDPLELEDVTLPDNESEFLESLFEEVDEEESQKGK